MINFDKRNFHICVKERAAWITAVFLYGVLVFPITSFNASPTQTVQDWKVENLAESFMTKRTEAFLRKSHLERKGRMCKAQRKRRFWSRRCMTVSTCENDTKDLANEPTPTCVCVLRGSKFRCVCVCLCVWSVRWGQWSQPADAGEPRRAGSQDGWSQTLIRESRKQITQPFLFSPHWQPFSPSLCPQIYKIISPITGKNELKYFFL